MTDKTDADTDAGADATTTANDNAARLQGHGLQASFGSLSETVRRLAVDLANEAGARAVAEVQLAALRVEFETLRAEVEGLKGEKTEKTEKAEKPKAKPAA